MCKILNTEPVLCYLRGLRYLQNKTRFRNSNIVTFFFKHPVHYFSAFLLQCMIFYITFGQQSHKVVIFRILHYKVATKQVYFTLSIGSSVSNSNLVINLENKANSMQLPHSYPQLLPTHPSLPQLKNKIKRKKWQP